MPVNRAFVPVVTAVAIAIIGTVVLFRMDFGSKNVVEVGPINMITTAAIGRAGAVAVPTTPRTQP